MHIALLDDYQDTLRTAPAFAQLAGHDVTVWTDHVQETNALAQRLHGTQALMLIRERTALTRELLERLPQLRVVSQFGVMPHIDLRACEDLGITVCSRTVPGQPSYATAELTWGLILAATRRIPQERDNLRAGGWQTARALGRTLRGRTLGVFGYGRIGAVVAGYARAFGMRVVAWGTERSRERAVADGFEAAPDAMAFFSGCDVITLHLGLNDDTRGIVTREHLGAMRPDALFVNTSRAQLVAPGALANALRDGRPGRAAVDVYEHEPVPGAADPLIAMDNVIATPHIGYAERGGLETMLATMVDQVLAFDRGEPMNVIVRGSR